MKSLITKCTTYFLKKTKNYLKKKAYFINKYENLLLTTAASMKIKLNGLFPHFPLLFKTSLHTFRFQSMFSASPIKNFNKEVFTENKKPGNAKPHMLAMSPPRTSLFFTHRFTALEREGFSSVRCVLAVEPT